MLALPAQADGTGFFLAGGVNYNAIDDTFDKDDFNPPEDLESIHDGSSTGFNLGGGWRFNKWLAVDAAYWDLEGDRFEDDGTDLYYGVGAAVNIFGSLDIYLEAVRFDAETDINSAGLGLRFTF